MKNSLSLFNSTNFSFTCSIKSQVGSSSLMCASYYCGHAEVAIDAVL